jgi:hypothetical protein
LGAAYLATFRVWLTDENQDLGKTMATLDKQLDRTMSLIGGTFGRSQPSEPVPSAGPPDVVAPEPAPVEAPPASPAKPVSPGKKAPARKPTAARKKPPAAQ